LVGGLLYLGLNWVPLAGPLIAGFVVGWLLKGEPGESFKAGVYSGILGFITVSILLSFWRFNTPSNQIISSLLIGWILLLWNVVGILFTGFGAMLYSIVNSFSRIFGIDLKTPSPPAGGRAEASYKICDKCGNGFLDENGGCSYCAQQQWTA